MNVREMNLTPEDLRFVPPAFPPEAVAAMVREEYGLSGSLSPLEGERDQNYRLKATDGKEYVVKISSLHEDLNVIDFQIRALLHIEQKDPGLPVPRLRPTLEGDLTTHIADKEGRPHPLRLLGYLPGIPFGESCPSVNGFEKIGAFQGRLSKALSDYQHRAADDFMPWDISNGLLFNSGLLNEARPESRELVCRFLPHLDQQCFPALSSLRHQVIHNDCHSGNLLRPGIESEEVAGVIDFGDMVRAPLVQDLAVSMAGFGVYLSDPLDCITAITRGYHSVYALEEEECALILDLVIMRLALTLLLFEFRLRTNENPPAFLIEERLLVMNTLQQLEKLERTAVATSLRNNCYGD